MSEALKFLGENAGAKLKNYFQGPFEWKASVQALHEIADGLTAALSLSNNSVLNITVEEAKKMLEGC